MRKILLTIWKFINAIVGVFHVGLIGIAFVYLVLSLIFGIKYFLYELPEVFKRHDGLAYFSEFMGFTISMLLECIIYTVFYVLGTCCLCMRLYQRKSTKIAWAYLSIAAALQIMYFTECNCYFAVWELYGKKITQHQ